MKKVLDPKSGFFPLNRVLEAIDTLAQNNDEFDDFNVVLGFYPPVLDWRILEILFLQIW